MYGKLFDSMYDGTLAEDWRALITFQQLIILCDADGIVDLTPSAISRRTGIPIEHIKAGLEILESPDPDSRTDGEEGRRIRLLDDHRKWGWYIVNHAKYKALQDSDTVREQNRARKQRQREREKESRLVTVGHSRSRHTDTNTDTNTDTEREVNKKRKPAARFTPPSVGEVEEYKRERNAHVDPERFVDFYASKNWMVGKSKMRDWRAAFRGWEKTETKGKDRNANGTTIDERLSDRSWANLSDR